MVQPDRPQTKTRRMRFACQITKATDTHSEYVILIAFPWQQWLREHPSMLRYMYIACLVRNTFRKFQKLQQEQLDKSRVYCASLANDKCLPTCLTCPHITQYV